MNRRTLLRRTGYALGGLGVLGTAGRYALLPPSPSRRLATVDELAREFAERLSPEARAATCFAYDDPLRQAHNRGVWLGGQRVWRNFDWDERQLLVEEIEAG